MVFFYKKKIVDNGMYTTNFKKKGKEKYKANIFSHVSEFLHIS